MIDPREIKEIFICKASDIGVLKQQVDDRIKQGWCVFPDSLYYDRGVFLIMVGKVKEKNGEQQDGN